MSEQPHISEDEPPSRVEPIIEISIASDGWADVDGLDRLVRVATEEVLMRQGYTTICCEISFKFTGNDESQKVNAAFRNKNNPTNVLSFPAYEAADLAQVETLCVAGGMPLLLGDILLADDVIKSEAKAQNKSIEAHVSHLIVHGVLHLMGYDHIADTEAKEMESIEREILKKLGYDDPYMAINET